jgi:hypothetical protein
MLTFLTFVTGIMHKGYAGYASWMPTTNHWIHRSNNHRAPLIEYGINMLCDSDDVKASEVSTVTACNRLQANIELGLYCMQVRHIHICFFSLIFRCSNIDTKL